MTRAALYSSVFRFTDQQRAKQRPTVVLSSTEYNTRRPDIILLALTNQVKKPLDFAEASVDDWRDAGLLKPSLFKPIIFTAEQSLVRKMLGQLSQRDSQTLRQLLGILLSS